MKRRNSLARTLVQLSVLVVLVVAGLNYQFIWDQYALATFKPTTDVAQIEGQLALTQTGRALFYRGQPQIDSKTQFNADCQTSRGMLELGCYYLSRIYVLHIEDARLAPEMQVVAAHELLHAAWLRLSRGEQATLTTELEQVYAGIQDQDLRDRMASYAKSEPGEEANELHSILGTEYGQLPPALEQYYSRYFANRSAIVAAHASYQQVFSVRRQELEQDLAQIRQLKGQLAVINRQLDSYKAAGRIDDYNALVPQQNHLVDTINSRIDDYRQAVDEYNALSQSLDSQQITDTEPSVQ